MERAGATTVGGTPLTLIGPELKAGEMAPDFSVIDSSLRPVRLADTAGRTRIFSVLPSLDTPICDAQTKRFNDVAQQLKEIDIYTVSMDLPYAQKRFCNSFALDHVKMLSDHKDASFGTQYGTLIKEMRLLSRAIFVLDPDNRLKHVEYVKEAADHPDYEAALAAAKS
ncbi:MAG: thiol peroxidase [Acidobacteriota bacterium]|nr:thiol peroxidase [Acidobacteriota bacterium]